jgi:hypothetical protein
MRYGTALQTAGRCPVDPLAIDALVLLFDQILEFAQLKPWSLSASMSAQTP